MERIRGSAALLLLLVVLACAASTTVSAVNCAVNNKQDCGYVGINQQQCVQKGCCWQPTMKRAGQIVQSVDGDPWCFYGITTPPQYTVSGVQQSSTGFTAQLSLSNPGAGTYGAALPSLTLTAAYETDSRVHFRITDASKARYEIPQSVLPYPQEGSKDFPRKGEKGAFDPANPAFTVAFSAPGQPLSLTVTRVVDGVVLFDLGDFEYSDQYLQLTNKLPQEKSSNAPLLYGVGEHVMNFKLPVDDHTFTMWNVDIPTPWDQNAYGSHPFYLQTLADTGLAHGVFVRSSAGMDVVTSTAQVQFRMIGGVMDWYVFAGPVHELVIQQYHAVIGRPHLPPYWSLGWHQCKYGWKTLAEVEGVVASYAAAQIPLDTVWADIDFMDQHEDFSWDPVNFPRDQVAAFTAQLHAKGQHYVPIVDPGIHNRSGYGPWEQGLAQDVFIKQGDGTAPYIGSVWPGSTAFPDFLHPNGSTYWTQQIKTFLQQVPYDGLWIDMNEISNFQDGGCTNCNSPVNNPPYAINNFGSRAPLDTKALPVDALHGQGKYLEYDVHNMYGLTEAIATRTALESIRGERSFILTRSSFPGSGVHVAHWLGDNHAQWDDLWRSIPGVLNANMYGIPMVGADICGFIGTTTEELCGRWTAMGAFYTFTRNHHEPGADQYPYLWPSVEAIAKRVLAMRYTLLPHLYTLLNNAHVSGGTVLRSMLFNYPKDSNTYAIDTQFMWGSSVLITPVLAEGATSVQGYWPAETIWYDAWTLAALPKNQVGQQTLPCSIEQGVLVHIAGGHILPTQAPGGALTTTEARLKPFGLLVALDPAGQANGEMFWDDGVNLVDGHNALQMAFNASTAAAGSGGVSWNVVSNTFSGSLPPLGSVTVAGLASSPRVVRINSVPLPSSAWQFDAQNGVLTVGGLNVNFAAQGGLSWSQSY